MHLCGASTGQQCHFLAVGTRGAQWYSHTDNGKPTHRNQYMASKSKSNWFKHVCDSYDSSIVSEIPAGIIMQGFGTLINGFGWKFVAQKIMWISFNYIFMKIDNMVWKCLQNGCIIFFVKAFISILDSIRHIPCFEACFSFAFTQLPKFFTCRISK